MSRILLLAKLGIYERAAPLTPDGVKALDGADLDAVPVETVERFYSAKFNELEELRKLVGGSSASVERLAREVMELFLYVRKRKVLA